MPTLQRVTSSTKPLLRELPLDVLQRALYQPRQDVSPEGLDSLVATIQQVGILEPLVVRPLTPHRYEIVAGERRWRAAQCLKLDTVPCLIGHYTDEQAAQIALIENTCREALNPLMEAQAIQRLIDQFGYTHEQVGVLLGMSRAAVTNTLRLLRLDARLQEWLKQGGLSESHGKVLAGVPYEQQYRLGYEAVKHNWSILALEEAIKTQKITKTSKHAAATAHTQQDIQLQRLERQLSDQLGYPLRITLHKNKAGRLTIDFINLDHLQGLLEKLGYQAE